MWQQDIRLEGMQMGTEERKKENEQKKEYLRGYRRHRRKIRRIEAEIEEIRSMKMHPSINNDGMPKKANQSDLSGYIAELKEKEDMLYQEGIEAVTTYKDIESQIKQLKEQDERDVLFYRYIKGYDWWQIAKEMDYSERWIYILHARALQKIQKV